MLSGSRLVMSSVLALLCCGAIAAPSGTTEGRDSRVTNMAHDAIVVDLLLKALPATSTICTDQRYACLTPDSAELGIALLGAQTTPEAARELLKLTRYRLGGGLDSDVVCYLLTRGKAIRSMVDSAKAKSMSTECFSEIQNKRTKLAPLFDDLDVGAVCESDDDIASKLMAISSYLKKGMRCADGDF